MKKVNSLIHDCCLFEGNIYLAYVLAYPIGQGLGTGECHRTG